MKIDVRNAKNEKTGQVALPSVFSEPLNADIIRATFVADTLNERQPYGGAPEAGKKSVAKLSRRRRKYRGSYGIGISRVPRKIMSRSGIRFNWVGSFAPGTVGGRRAHPPKAQKIVAPKVNQKERAKAMRSALAATLDAKLVKANGFRVPDSYPFVLDDSFEQMAKTKDVVDALNTLGFESELSRASIRKVRPGRGTMRSRRYRTKTSILFVVSDDAALARAARNIPGVEIVPARSLRLLPLAPGSKAGRATLFTGKAIADIGKRLSPKVSS